MNDGFILLKKYRFIPEFGPPHKTIIEIEIYKNNICIVSFYAKNKGNEKSKYKLRTNYKSGQVLAILKSTIKAFNDLGNNEYALIFNASNDIGIINEEFNDRYNLYLKFLERYFPNFEDCIQKGSIALNTFLVYPKDFEFRDNAEKFFEEFEQKVKSEYDEQFKINNLKK